MRHESPPAVTFAHRRPSPLLTAAGRSSSPYLGYWVASFGKARNFGRFWCVPCGIWDCLLLRLGSSRAWTRTPIVVQKPLFVTKKIHNDPPYGGKCRKGNFTKQPSMFFPIKPVVLSSLRVSAGPSPAARQLGVGVLTEDENTGPKESGPRPNIRKPKFSVTNSFINF
jgi:hypothetical protein